MKLQVCAAALCDLDGMYDYTLGVNRHQVFSRLEGDAIVIPRVLHKAMNVEPRF